MNRRNLLIALGDDLTDQHIGRTIDAVTAALATSRELTLTNEKGLQITLIADSARIIWKAN